MVLIFRAGTTGTCLQKAKNLQGHTFLSQLFNSMAVFIPRSNHHPNSPDEEKQHRGYIPELVRGQSWDLRPNPKSWVLPQLHAIPQITIKMLDSSPEAASAKQSSCTEPKCGSGHLYVQQGPSFQKCPKPETMPWKPPTSDK